MSVDRTVLDNGITIVSEQVPHLISVTAGIWVSVGSRAESSAESGIGHFIEHMLFKGTRRRTALDISREIESVGGTINACTDREYTFFFAKALSKDFSLVADLLSDIYVDSLFDGEELDREKGVVLQEILMVEDNPEEFLHDFFHESYWGGHPLGFPVQGKVATVESFTRDRVVGYFRDRFRRRGLIVSVVGNLPHDRIVGEFSRALGSLRLGEPLLPEGPPTPVKGTYMSERALEQLHICLGAPGIPRRSELRYVAHVLSTILGGSVCSRLFQEVREKRGLAYSIFSSLSSYADSGILKICVGTTGDKAKDVLDITADVLENLREGRFDDDEVRLARELLKGNMLLGLESPENRMSRLALNEMFIGRVETPEESLKGVDEVTPDRARDLAATMLRRDRFSMASVGEFTGGNALSF